MKLIIIILIISMNSFAMKLKMRAREHYEVHEVYTASGMEIYRGLTNTINLWWENPYDYSFGFSFSPIIAGINAEDYNQTFGDVITQQNIGFEYKFFIHSISKNLFVRTGIGYSRLETTRGRRNNFFGNFSYLGFGKEIPFDNFGLALEMAYRYADYDQGIIIKTITPSIGFHFYKDF